MQDYIRKDIPDVIENINKSYFLPDIQRNFVWKPEQVYKLFDSLMRSYPINTFLFWILKGKAIKDMGLKKLEFVSRSDEDNKENTSTNKDKEYYFVLDGQQRLTTFYLVLKGNYIIRNHPYELYYNIMSGLEEVDDVLYEFKFYNKKKGKLFAEKDKKGTIEKLWYSVKEIYDSVDPDEVYDLLDELEDKNDLSLDKNQKKSFSRLNRIIKSEKIIYYYPESAQDEDRVLDIFVRTNSGGTQLSYSDLLFSNIKSKWKEARESFDSLITRINDSEKFKYSNDFLLKSILLLNGTDVNSIRYKTMNFKPDLINRIKEDEYWKNFIKAVMLAADIIKDKCFLTNNKLITSYNAIIPLVYWIFKNSFKGFGSGKNFINDLELSRIKTWLIKALLSGVFGGQSDTILIKCKEAIDINSSIFDAQGIEDKIELDTKKDMRVDEDDINKIHYNDSYSYLVLSIIYKMSINFHPNFIGNFPEQDHLFSQHELENAKIKPEIINSIYNIRYVGKAANQSKSSKPFKDWILTQSKDDRKMHLIPDGNWNLNNFSDFLNERKKLILNNFAY